MNVNFEYYKIFFYVAKYHNFTKAAHVLGNSQPNVTRAMNCLEQQINTLLFVRTNRGVELTPEGVELKEIAPGIDPQKDILDQMDFHPIIKNVTRMDPRIFQEGLMGLKEQVHD